MCRSSEGAPSRRSPRAHAPSSLRRAGRLPISPRRHRRATTTGSSAADASVEGVDAAAAAISGSDSSDASAPLIALLSTPTTRTRARSFMSPRYDTAGRGGLFRLPASNTKPPVARGFLVDLRGLEPLTPCMPCRCATSCATGPDRFPLRRDNSISLQHVPGLFEPSPPRAWRATRRNHSPAEAPARTMGTTGQSFHRRSSP